MPVYTFTTIDDPLATGFDTRALGINDAGQIVGTYTRGNSHGFLLSAGVFTTIDDPFADGGTDVSGINASGQIVGTYFFAGIAHAFLYSGGTNGTYTNFDEPLAVVITDARAINNTGQIVGQFRDASNRRHGYLLSGGTFFTLDDPSATGDSITNGINDTPPSSVARTETK